MTDPDRSRRRPVLAADLDALAGVTEGGAGQRLDLAHATASALVDAGRGLDGPATRRLVQLAETVGLDTLSELWRDAAADSLPGCLWALYLLRTWCLRQGDAVSRMYRAGRALAPVDEVVAGVADDADPDAVAALADAVLTGAYRGEFDVALQRAAAFFRIVGIGRRECAPDGPDGAAEHERAERNLRCAQALERAAMAWREGCLQ